MLSAPMPPASSTEMRPPEAVFEIVPAKVLHGDVREHGFASSPVPDTQVWVACAWAAPARANRQSIAARRAAARLNVGIGNLGYCRGGRGPRRRKDAVSLRGDLRHCVERCPPPTVPPLAASAVPTLLSGASMRLRLSALAVSVGLALTVNAAAYTNERGLDARNFDTKVSPCVDFYRYANGGWLASNPIPPEYSN